MDNAIQEQLGGTLAAVREVLGDDVVGVYVHGSAVLGGLRPRSDLDVLVVSRRSTTRDEKRLLLDRLLVISGNEAPGMPRPIELIVVVQFDIRPWRYPPSFDFKYGEWLRAKFVDGELEPWSTTVDRDLAVVIAITLIGNRPLFGPPPAEVLDPVPPADLTRAMVADLASLDTDLEWDTRNAVLTLARVWHTVATGQIASKDVAASWALERLPEKQRSVLGRARAIYRGEFEGGWDDLRPGVRPYVDYVDCQIRLLVSS